MASADDVKKPYVGAIVGESTSQEFRIAVNPDSVREQDIIALDADMQDARDANKSEQVRIWAKVQRIERLNPLFPLEAGHELAHTKTDPFDTVLSLSREMVTAVCQVLGWEPQSHGRGGKLNQLRYPPKPASSAYSPSSSDIARIVVGDLEQEEHRALDIAKLANRDDVDVCVNGHAVVMRHLAILAMTGAGKSWAARRVIEELAKKNYPIVIFDPRGDYTGLAELESLKGRVNRYYAQFPVFEQDADTVMSVVESLGWALANTHKAFFDSLFEGAKSFIKAAPDDLKARTQWLSGYLHNPKLEQYGLKPNLYYLADFVQALVIAAKTSDSEAQQCLVEWSKQENLKLEKKDANNLEGLPNNLRTAAKRLREMEDINKQVAESTQPLPNDRTELVQYGHISVIALAGYAGHFQAMICGLIADSIFSARVAGKLKLPVLMVMEEAHNFVPANASTPSEAKSTAIIRQIAQEGRKFRVGLMLISQRPSRLDETTLSMCNSFIIMRMVNPADQNFVRKVMETIGEEEVRMLPDLEKGEAILSGQMINFPVLVKMKPPEAQGEHEEKDAFMELNEDYQNLLKERKK